MSRTEPLAVVDIGSNSIKLLVGLPGTPLQTLRTDIRETRISAGMQGNPPTLQEAAMQAGLESIRQLVAEAEKETSRPPLLVATSAVRDAANGKQFCLQVERALGLEIRVLSGEEEAHYISMGALCDPSLFGIQDFRLIDLGGGSLEVVYYKKGKVAFAASLSLGAVRLTHRFLPDPSGPVHSGILESIEHRIEQVFQKEAIQISDPRLNLVGSGGAFTIARNLINPRCPTLHLADLQEHLKKLSQLPLEARKKIPGLPPERADIMIPALQTMVTLAKLAKQETMLTTKFNLRYGILREHFQST